MFKNITKVVWLVSLISLFNDFSSEMLYPIIPLYLQQIGYGSLLIGILEGVSECVAGLSKIYMGSLSDHVQRRLPFVQVGYFLSIVSRPFIGLTSIVGFIFLGRSLDRMGKGIRSGARDALLADESTPQTRAEVFGFHRSMDTFGAVLGPLAAMAYLYFHPENFKALFLITLIFGSIAIIATFLIKEKKKTQENKKTISLKKHFSYAKNAPKPYLKLVSIFLLFSLVNSSDMFLLLRAKESGMSEQHVLMLYLLFNLCFSLFAFPIGKLADRYGRMQLFLIGLLVYAMTYSLFALQNSHTFIIVGFILYGLFYAFTQGTTKVLLIEQVPADQKSSAIGFYEGLNSFSLLIANAFAGWIWFRFGSATMLTYSSLITILIFMFMAWLNIIQPKLKGMKK